MKQKIGVWLIGARGGVATTAILGWSAFRQGLIPDCGLVSQNSEFDALNLVEFEDLVFGGHEIRNTTVLEQAEDLAKRSRAFPEKLVESCRADLELVDQNIRPGSTLNVGSVIGELADSDFVLDQQTPSLLIGKLQEDMEEFQKEHNLARVIVVNVASTEPSGSLDQLPGQWDQLEEQIDQPAGREIPGSCFYAIAALKAGFPYLNFTPSVGSGLPAICDLAFQNGVPHMGHDGKTGETLLKSALAPMFARRNLDVMSWVGHNIFGNMDAQVLDQPENKQTKVVSKDRLLGQILGYQPDTLVSIERVDSLGDWKTAWDHIHFKGFLGTPMTLQLTWQGCDSVLAAPLVLDLVRFAEKAQSTGHKGLMPFLSCFFKSPLGTEENNFELQYQELCTWSKQISSAVNA